MYDKFVKLLNLKGVKPADVAKATGIHPSTFTDWKKGKSSPKAEKLQKIADFFGVSIDYFLTDQKETYYIDHETAEIAQQLFENADLRTLFDAAKDCTPEDLKMAAELLSRLKGTNPNG